MVVTHFEVRVYYVCQVHKYLLISGQQLEIDMFNFDWWVQVFYENLCLILWYPIVSPLSGVADI